MSMQAVGIYLRNLRQGLGLTQGEAADKVGLVAKTVERWEAGKHEPKLSELASYVRALGGSVKRAVSLLIDIDEPDPLGFTPEELAALARLSPGKKQALLDLIDRFESGA